MSALTKQPGFTLIEVLVTLVIIAIGLLGLSGLQAKLQVSELEAMQRSQAALLVQNMANRIRNRDWSSSSSYDSATTFGTGHTPNADCTSLADAARDHCEWSKLLLGVTESVDVGGTITNFGAMIGARGCIEELQAPNNAIGSCQTGNYRVSVTWQGLNPTKAPEDVLDCAKNAYGDEKLRRIITADVVIGVPKCF